MAVIILSVFTILERRKAKDFCLNKSEVAVWKEKMYTGDAVFSGTCHKVA